MSKRKKALEIAAWILVAVVTAVSCFVVVETQRQREEKMKDLTELIERIEENQEALEESISLTNEVANDLDDYCSSTCSLCVE